MIPDTHPYWHVKGLLERRNDVISLRASFYSYRPQTVTDERITFDIGMDAFSDVRTMIHLFESVPLGQELALHSDLRLRGGQSAHIVMVDMSTASRAHLTKLRAFLGDNFYQQIAWYSSGRSFHGYGDTLLAHDEWVRFMGLLLLANQPRFEPTVDPRWIGHRLFAGYASLRWTCNTSHYLGLPKSVEAARRLTRVRSEVGPIGKRLGKS